MSLVSIPKLEELVADPDKVSLLPPEAVPNLRAELAHLDSLLLMRLAFPQNNCQGQVQGSGDRLLGAKQTAERMGVSLDYIYKNADNLPL